MQKKNVSLFIISLIIIGGSLIYFENKKSLPDSKPATNPTIINSKTKLLEQSNEHAGLQKANLTEQEKASECHSSLELIETLPVNTLVSELGRGALKLDKDCLIQSNLTLNMLHDFPGVCAKLENGQPTADCKRKLSYFKAYRIHLALPDTNFMSLSTELLIQKFVGLMVAGAASTSKGLLLLRAAGAELYNRLPDSESAAKAAFINYLESDSKSLDKESKKNYDALVADARAKFPNSLEIFELDLVKQQTGNESTATTTISNFYNNNPNSDVAIYYMGCNLWHQKNATQAQELLNKALAMKPTNKRYKYSVEQSLKVQPPEGICYYEYSFDPDNF